MSTIADVVIDSHVHMWDRTRFTYSWLGAEAAVLGGTALATYDSRRHALQSKES